MKKVLFNTVSIIYVIIAIIITLCLLSYNEFDVPERGNVVLISIKEKNNNFKKGSLLFIEKDNDVKENDEVYYFSSMKEFSYGKVTNLEDETLMINGDIISYDNIIGANDDVKEVYFIGYIFNLLTSKLGYLLIIIFPVLVLFLYEIYLFSTYIKSFKNKIGGKNEKNK